MSWTQDGDDSESLKDRTLYVPLANAKGAQTVEISLTEHKAWIGLNHIDRMTFSLPGRNQQAVISRLTFTSDENKVPRFEFDPKHRNSAGFKPLEDARGVVWLGGAIGPFSYDVSGIPNADHAVYELSKRDYWFGNKMRDDAFAPDVTVRAGLEALKGTAVEVKIAEKLQPGYYDFRIFAVDNKGKILGYSCDPANLWLEPHPVRTGRHHSEAIKK
jgi:hypothetical protein